MKEINSHSKKGRLNNWIKKSVFLEGMSKGGSWIAFLGMGEASELEAILQIKRRREKGVWPD